MIEKNVSIEILLPIKNNLIKQRPKNNNSLVMLFEIYKTKILFTGDIEKEGEDLFLKKYLNRNLNIDVLVVAHHGSNTSSGTKFLEKVKPNISIISCGKNNIFKHPHEKVLERLKNIKSKILRTDLSGLISIKIYENRKIKIKEYMER